MVWESLDMASLNAAKQQLRAVMKQRLGAVSNESALVQSMALLDMMNTEKG